ncbi:MAG: tyrosine-type recombinase/integrase, partial [Acidimicrobiales bacterium]
MAGEESEYAQLAASFERSLRARKLSPKTIKAYLEAVRIFAEHQTANSRPLALDLLTRTEVETFIIDQLDRWSPSTAATRFRCLQQFFRWLVIEDEIAVSPMANMSPPTVADVPVPILSDNELRRLLAACDGKGFDKRRDTALVRMFLATGIRLGEMAGLTVDAVDLDASAALVHGKGDRSRWVTFGDRSAVALDRYLRERRRHRLAHLDALWLAPKGALTDSGITQALRRRAHVAGIDNMHPHRFRHTFAHRWLAAGVPKVICRPSPTGGHRRCWPATAPQRSPNVPGP